MEKKVLLKDLVSTGTHIRTTVIPKAVISDNGEHQIAEFWDANKTIDVIVNNSHKQHDNIRELDEYTHAEESRAKSEEHRLDTVKVGRITVEDIKALTETEINKLTTGDVVIKSKDGKAHAYTVAYKKDNEMSLVYADHETVEEVYYEKNNDTWAYIQTDNLEFKTVAGQSILGTGNIDIQAVVKANEPMPDYWDKSHTMLDLINSINADDTVSKGKIYLSTCHISDLPGGMTQAEVKVEIMGKQSGEFIMLFTVTSADIAPYKWEYTAYHGSKGPWRSWITSSTSLFSGSYNDLSDKPTNVSTFNNDAGYLTSHQDLTSLINRIEVLEAAAGISHEVE